MDGGGEGGIRIAERFEDAKADTSRDTGPRVPKAWVLTHPHRLRRSSEARTGGSQRLREWMVAVRVGFESRSDSRMRRLTLLGTRVRVSLKRGFSPTLTVSGARAKRGRVVRRGFENGWWR